ncbi:uncharacterized protein B0J16DRAFT_333971, partial [Fusarium flagelliforme]
MKEIGLDLESLAATMGDALAMIIYKCRLAYFGSFLFRPMPIVSKEHPGSSTISLCISWVHFSIIDVGILSYPRAMEGMLSHWKQNVPSPNESRYLWNVFKAAFISRGNRYCSIPIGITPQDMMRRFETLYDELTDADQLPGTKSRETMRGMAEAFS